MQKISAALRFVPRAFQRFCLLGDLMPFVVANSSPSLAVRIVAAPFIAVGWFPCCAFAAVFERSDVAQLMTLIWSLAHLKPAPAQD